MFIAAVARTSPRFIAQLRLVCKHQTCACESIKPGGIWSLKPSYPSHKKSPARLLNTSVTPDVTNMIAQDSYNTASTNVKLSSVPEDTTGLERIMLAAQGDLQRLLSAFFGRPIHVKCIYANGSPRVRPASPEHPITQSRQVHLLCNNRVVCVATSVVTITSPDSERLFLDDKYPIGQTFRQLRRHPRFTLLKVETPVLQGKRGLRRTYTLETEGFHTEILEVFPDRDMFRRGEDWLLGSDSGSSDEEEAYPL